MCVAFALHEVFLTFSFVRWTTGQTDSWTSDAQTKRGMHVTFQFLVHEWGRKKVSEKEREREKQGTVHRNSLKEGTFLSLFFNSRFKLSHTNIITYLKWRFWRMALNNFKGFSFSVLRSVHKVILIWVCNVKIRSNGWLYGHASTIGPFRMFTEKIKCFWNIV